MHRPTARASARDTTPARASFRHHLRQETARDHDAAEAFFALFLADPATHIHGFLAAQRMGFAALRRALGPVEATPGGAADGHEGAPDGHPVGHPDTDPDDIHRPAASRARLDRIIARLDRDCDAFGIMPGRIDHAARLSPVAVDYLTLGSRLGTEVIHRKLGARGFAPMPRHVATPSPVAPWRKLCARLDRLDAGGIEARRIVADTRRGYGLIQDAARRAGFDARGAA